MPKTLNQLSDRKSQIVFAPLLELGFDIFETNGKLTPFGKEIVTRAEFMLSDVMKDKLTNYLSGKRTEKFRFQVTEENVHRHRNLFHWLK